MPHAICGSLAEKLFGKVKKLGEKDASRRWSPSKLWYDRRVLTSEKSMLKTTSAWDANIGNIFSSVIMSKDEANEICDMVKFKIGNTIHNAWLEDLYSVNPEILHEAPVSVVDVTVHIGSRSQTHSYIPLSDIIRDLNVNIQEINQQKSEIKVMIETNMNGIQKEFVCPALKDKVWQVGMTRRLKIQIKEYISDSEKELSELKTALKNVLLKSYESNKLKAYVHKICGFEKCVMGTNDECNENGSLNVHKIGSYINDLWADEGIAKQYLTEVHNAIEKIEDIYRKLCGILETYKVNRPEPKQ